MRTRQASRRRYTLAQLVAMSDELLDLNDTRSERTSPVAAAPADLIIEPRGTANLARRCGRCGTASAIRPRAPCSWCSKPARASRASPTIARSSWPSDERARSVTAVIGVCQGGADRSSVRDRLVVRGAERAPPSPSREGSRRGSSRRCEGRPRARSRTAAAVGAATGGEGGGDQELHAHRSSFDRERAEHKRRDTPDPVRASGSWRWRGRHALPARALTQSSPIAPNSRANAS
jgi:hypothetical protein